MAYFLRKKVTGNVYVDEAISGIFEYKWADTVETGWEEAHTVGDETTQAACEARWGADASDDTLAAYKTAKYGSIDLKTGALILQGFAYDSALFSASTMAQQNWSSIKENTSDYTFPLLVSTLDNNEYSLAEANVTAFWTTGRDHVKGHLDSGRSLKKSVFDAVDKAAVDAVVDNR